MRFVTKTIRARLDYPVALALIGLPFALGFSGLDAAYYWLSGAAVVTVIGLSKPETDMVSA
ncbi:MAG: hypothetical protein K8F57_00575 [Alphaproteobacteria bacterium]|nr:hypothetical protein [Alphaproteobacteria bacterium]